jgi:rhamnosyltransferase
MVQALLETYADAVRSGCKVGSVGPRVLDPDGGEDGFVRFRSGRYEAVPVKPGDRWIDCDMLIASGSLVPCAAYAKVGGMAEHLFIDKVDTEWCLRAASHGYRLIGAPAAVLHHRLGEQAVRVWFLQWRELRAHKPFRYYYMVRNAVLLRRLQHSTAAWRRADRRQLMSIFLYFGLLLPQRGAVLRMMLRGLLDGCRNISGPMR